MVASAQSQMVAGLLPCEGWLAEHACNGVLHTTCIRLACNEFWQWTLEEAGLGDG
jgi:hypothetical protein